MLSTGVPRNNKHWRISLLKTNFDMVEDFMNAFGQDVEKTPMMSGVAELRYELIREELEEMREALDSKD
jgi:predicted transcriptional regulator